MTEITIPIGRMPASALPPPSSMRLTDGVARNYGDWRDGGILMHGTPDAQVRPDQWELTYDSVPSQVVNAIRAHYRDFSSGAWVWLHPLTDEPIVVIHAAPPSITWRHRIASANARVFLELATARN